MPLGDPQWAPSPGGKGQKSRALKARTMSLCSVLASLPSPLLPLGLQAPWSQTLSPAYGIFKGSMPPIHGAGLGSGEGKEEEEKKC